MFDKLRKMNLRLGKVTQFLTPGYGSCGKCETTWAFVEGHSTIYLNGSGCFPLCELCWSELLIEDRLPFYRSLVEHWISSGEVGWYQNDVHFFDIWKAIEAAVLRGE